jgi:hypothetical protein
MHTVDTAGQVPHTAGMDLKACLIATADAYLRARTKPLSKARLATIIAKDGKFFNRIEAGGLITTRTYERAMQWFSNEWPAHVPWPSGVARPAPLPTDKTKMQQAHSDDHAPAL